MPDPERSAPTGRPHAAAALGIGLIGAGRMGGRHARNLARTGGARLAAVADADAARAAAVAGGAGAAVCTDAAALIDAPEVDAVVVASPSPTHADLAVACIEAGKPVLCEKPLATTLAGARRAVDAEAAAGRKLVQVGFMRVHDPAHLALHGLLRRGDIGRPLCFRSGHCNLRVPEPCMLAGAVTNSAIHDIHSARWLMDDEIVRVHASRVAGGGGPQGCRLLLLHLVFAGGALGTIEFNPDSGYGYEVTVEIAGETGVAGTDALPAPALRRDGRRSVGIASHWLERFGDAYRIEAEEWVRAVRDGVPAGPDAWDGYMSLAVADAAMRSAASGVPAEVQATARPALYATPSGRQARPGGGPAR